VGAYLTNVPDLSIRWRHAVAVAVAVADLNI